MLKKIIPTPARLCRAAKIAREIFKIQSADLEKYPPILVYQMGKVGSRSVLETLRKNNMPNSVFHTHSLACNRIETISAEQNGRARLGSVAALNIDHAIRRRIDRSPNVRWKVITLVRDPIAQHISGFFHNISSLHADVLANDGSLDIEKAGDKLLQRLQLYADDANHASRWFDAELRTVFDIDVFQVPFDREQGWDHFSTDRVDLLILRTEDLNESIGVALKSFLEVEQNVRCFTNGTANQQAYFAEYLAIKQNLKLPYETCNRIFQSRLAIHFYTEATRKKMIAHWSE